MLLYYFLEIKNRTILLILSWVSIFFVCYSYKEILLYIIIKPSLNLSTEFNKIYFITTDITEIFNTYINLASFISNQIIIFLLLNHFRFFLAPGLYSCEKKKLKAGFCVYLLFAISSNLFLYYILLPMSWNFFFHFQQILSNEQLNLYFEAKLSEYLKFFITLSHVSTLISQVFTIIFLYIKNMTNYLKFIKKNKKLIFFIFILLATIITPPEVFSQLIVGSFIVICYEIIVIIILFLNVNKVIR